MRCERHGIAAGPDGRCALCRREASSATGGTERILWLGALGLGLVTVAVVLARSRTEVSSRAVSAVAESPSALPEPPSPVEPEPQAEPEPVPERPPAPEVATPPDASAEADVPSSAPAMSASAAASAPSPAASQARPSESAFASAVRATPIVMFSTDWCPVCQRARDFLSANGLSYKERDIDHDENARDELKRRTGKASIPTIEVDGQLLTPGFSERAIMAAVAASTQRRLGVDAVEIRPAP